MRPLAFLLLLSCAHTPPSGGQDDSTLRFEEKGVNRGTFTLEQLKKKVPVERVSGFDPYYQRTKRWSALPLEPGDAILICSDGLTDGLWDRHLEEILRAGDLATVAPRLVTAGLEQSGRDNLTALAVEVIAP